MGCCKLEKENMMVCAILLKLFFVCMFGFVFVGKTDNAILHQPSQAHDFGTCTS